MLGGKVPGVFFFFFPEKRQIRDITHVLNTRQDIVKIGKSIPVLKQRDVPETQEFWLAKKCGAMLKGKKKKRMGSMESYVGNSYSFSQP